MRSYTVFPAVVFLSFLIAFCGCGERKSISISLVDSHLGRNIEKLSENFSSETGVDVDFRWVSEGNFDDEALSGPTLERGVGSDLIVGDVKWLGVGISRGIYADLTDWLKMDQNFGDIAPVALRHLSEYPPGSVTHPSA